MLIGQDTQVSFDIPNEEVVPCPSQQMSLLPANLMVPLVPYLQYIVHAQR